MPHPSLRIDAVDPREPDAAALISLLSRDLAQRYDFVDDGSGAFHVDDVLVPRAAFLVGRTASQLAAQDAAAGQPTIAGRAKVGGETGGQLLAVACGAYRPFGPDEPRAVEVKRMYVRPEFRGRGYAAAILAELERRAGADGYRLIRLETGNRQPEAIGLYEWRGYRRIGNWGKYVGHIAHQCYEKTLG